MCKWTEIRIEPRDVLFFRSAKPISGSAIGEGGNWPMPSIFHQALLSAFHAKWPEFQDWEHEHSRGKEKNPDSTCRFGGLKTVGVFPEMNGKFYFPMPADVQVIDNESEAWCVLQPGKFSEKSSTDLPNPLKKGLFKLGEATKKRVPQWISTEGLRQYLRDSVLTEAVPELFDVESRPGIGINAERQSAEDGRFYIAEYMRLRDGVSFKGFASCEQMRYADEKEPVDVMGKFFDGEAASFIFGGQRGVAALSGVHDDACCLPKGVEPSGCRVKWVLLTPAIFTGGWLPSWIDEKNGAIQGVEAVKPGRQPGETRQQWRNQFQKNTVPGQLVAACIPKPVPFSGWKAYATDSDGAKATRLCVPAGAVYYFETECEEDAQTLFRFLDGKMKSDMAAEKGFGFGLCGVWKEYNEGEK